MYRKSIFELLSENSDYISEYGKLIKMIRSDIIYTNYENAYTLEGFINNHIEDWKYRGTCTCFNEILKGIGITNNTDKENAVSDLLYLIELIINLGMFLKTKAKEELYESMNYLDDYQIEWIQSPSYFPKGLLFNNCIELLNRLGYIIQKDGDRLLIKNNDVDAIATALEIKDKDISRLLLDYIDFRNENDLEVKKNILYSIAEYLEPLKDKIPNDDLKNTLFKLFNNVNIRHNNKKGKKKNELAASLTNEEQIEWYDRTFSLALTAIRLLEFKEDKAIYDQVKE